MGPLPPKPPKPSKPNRSSLSAPAVDQRPPELAKRRQSTNPFDDEADEQSRQTTVGVTMNSTSRSSLLEDGQSKSSTESSSKTPPSLPKRPQATPSPLPPRPQNSPKEGVISNPVANQASSSGKRLLSSNSNSGIYDKVTMSTQWMIVALLMHVGQFYLMLSYGQPAMHPWSFSFTIVLAIAVVCCLLWSRYLVKKKAMPSRELPLCARLMPWRYRGKDLGHYHSPEDETDSIPPMSIYLVAVSAIIEGSAFALFAAAVAGLA